MAKPNNAGASPGRYTGHVHLGDDAAATQRALDALPVRDLPQVGSKTAGKLASAFLAYASARTQGQARGQGAEDGHAVDNDGDEQGKHKLALTVGEVRRLASREGLVKVFGAAKGTAIWDYAHGVDDGAWEPRAPHRKSVSSQVARLSFLESLRVWQHELLETRLMVGVCVRSGRRCRGECALTRTRKCSPF
jgi:nucleotidyltransferase/DNA polymerase involved in DNA repair